MLDGVNAASLAPMAVVTARLGAATLVDPVAAALTLMAVVLLVRFGVGSAWLVAGGAGIGLIATWWLGAD